ncbi:MAG: UDP-N-acetylmuramoyl-L-alanine--D-glutamate ligase [Cellulophaga sp.]
MTIINYKNLDVAVVGFGIEGKAVINYFHKYYPKKEIFVIDEKLKVDQNEKHPNLKYILGQKCLDKLVDFDIIFISPGISIYKKEVKQAKKKGVLISSATQLWYDHHKHDLSVFITGTKGKSTTSSLIHHVLRKLNNNVHLIGNIGLPAASQIDIASANNTWIVELSSFQSAVLKASPTISVLLNLFPEHIDWHDTVEQYYKDKLRIISSTVDGTAIINSNSKEKVNKILGEGKRTYFNDPSSFHHKYNNIYKGNKKIFLGKHIPLNGEHNLENICAMLCVIGKMGIDPEQAVELLSDFQNLPHRMEEFATVNEVLFVDDSISTIPQSAIKALNYYKKKHVTLIFGGLDRGLDWDKFSIWLAKSSVRNIIGLPETGHSIVNKINSMPEYKQKQLFLVDDLGAAVAAAKKITPRHGVVILTPAAPSQNKFRDYKERGTTFKKLVLE